MAKTAAAPAIGFWKCASGESEYLTFGFHAELSQHIAEEGEGRKQVGEGTNVDEAVAALLGAPRLADAQGWAAERVEVGRVDEVLRRRDAEGGLEGDVAVKKRSGWSKR